MDNLYIVDDALDDSECTCLLNSIKGSKIKSGASWWLGDYIDDLPIYWFDSDTDHLCKDLYIRLLVIASNYFDISAFVGYETWTHINSKPADWHQDKDERLIQIYDKLQFPLCTLVYYPFVDKDLKGGRVVFEDDTTVVPKTNRLIIFGPGVWHSVEEYTGERFALIIGPWNKKICMEKCYDPNAND